MGERGRGRVRYVASDSAAVIPAETIHYGMSETVLLAVSRGFAEEAAGSGVTVNSVIAGPTPAEGGEEFVYQLVGRDLPSASSMRVADPVVRLSRPGCPPPPARRSASTAAASVPSSRDRSAGPAHSRPVPPPRRGRSGCGSRPPARSVTPDSSAVSACCRGVLRPPPGWPPPVVP